MQKFSLRNKRVLVTGGAGVIGVELVQLLDESGARVRVVDFVEKPAELAGIEYFRLDLSHPDSQFLFRFEPEYVFHLAADFERSTEDLLFWNTNFSNNVLASHYLLEQVTRYPSLKKIIFASSYLIYNKKLYNDPDHVGNLSETDEISPRNLCGVAKLQTERDIEFLHEQLQRFEHVSARIFRVYGKGSRDIVSRWVRAALNEETLTLFSKENRFDYIYAGDVARGLYELAVSPEAAGIVNLGTGKATSVAELVDQIRQVVRDVPIRETKEEIYPEGSCADVSRLARLTGWRPETSLRQGVELLEGYERSRAEYPPYERSKQSIAR